MCAVCVCMCLVKVLGLTYRDQEASRRVENSLQFLKSVYKSPGRKRRR